MYDHTIDSCDPGGAVALLCVLKPTLCGGIGFDGDR